MQFFVGVPHFAPMLELAVEVREVDKSMKESPGDEKLEEIKNEPESEEIKN